MPRAMPDLLTLLTCAPVKTKKRSSIRHYSPGGSLTLTSGSKATRPGKNNGIAGGLNAGVCTLTKGLAADLADKRVRVNCVIPD